MYYLQPDTMRDSNGLTTIAVASQGTIFTKAHKIGAASAFSMAVAFASSVGTPNVQIDMQVSDTAPAALEGVVDSVGLDWCTQEGGSTILTVNDKVLHKITINPTPSQYIRFKLTGLTGNPADTTANLKVVTQQQLGR